MTAAELAQLLRLRTDALARVSDERDALKIALGQRIGGGIDVTKFEAFLVCRECSNVVEISAGTHICSP